MKYKLLFIIWMLLSANLNAQVPVDKLENSKFKSIHFTLEERKSDIILQDSLNLLNKQYHDVVINNFLSKYRADISTHISALNVINIQRGKLIFNSYDEYGYELGFVVNNFLIDNLSFESFAHIRKDKNYKIGVFIYYDFPGSIFGITFVEICNNKYYLIYSITAEDKIRLPGRPIYNDLVPG
ncbi:hypothetical protein LX64_01841 [Chitinophaga skermanii]|uniref:Uncharacterized protein n=1 Tax=Chitinophaga skermanii TaxID=331697 RepID=A0A327QSV0_9BACT|nr:hypothetical protein [Chitinophaga skermanii]RAJ06714.1 hypothetical protein LX64_01841 [Chitinophaga skermanii]